MNLETLIKKKHEEQNFQDFQILPTFLYMVDFCNQNPYNVAAKYGLKQLFKTNFACSERIRMYEKKLSELRLQI